MTTPDLPASEDISDDDDLLSVERAAEDDEEDEDRPKRHFILVSGGPGPYDSRDIEHDASWANYVTPPLLLTDTKAKRKAFRAVDEEVAWLVYKPAYERRWTADSRSSNADRKKAVRKIKDQGFTSYVDLIAARAKERGWSLHWLTRGADLWTKLKTFEPKSISRLCYWGHARDDLWLSIEHHPTSGSAIEPKIDEVITVGAIDVALKNRFQSGHRSRLHRFVGCNTKAFATAWAKAYDVWTEGVVDKVQFKSIHATGGEPCLANAATVNWFKPGGSVDASQLTALPACSAVGISESFIAATAVESWGDEDGSEGLYDTPTEIDADGVAGDGAQLVALAEAALHGAPAPLTAAMLLERALEYSGMSPPDAISRPGGGLCLTSLYGALTGEAPGRRSAVDERFEVVAAPGGIPSGPFAAGDILLRRPPGQPRLAHVAILVDGEVITDRALVPRRWEAERAAPGGYALVVEGGAFPHCRHREFARRVLDARGCVPAAQVVIRIRSPGAGAGRLDGEDVGATVLGEQAARAIVRVRNRLRDVESLADCVVELVGTLAHGVTDASGRAEIDLAGVADGRYMLSVLPVNRTTDPVGPSIASATPRPQRIWRPLDAQVTVVGGRITASTHADVSVSGSTLTAKVQPVWMASNRNPRRSTSAMAITHIVIHHTGGPKIDRALDDWVTQRRASTHYVIDADGQIIKLVHEADAAWHAGPAHWDGRDDLNDFTIAIEIVNAHPSPFTAAQYDALIELLGRIGAAHPDIPAWNMIGHSDIATCPAAPPSRCATETVRRLGRKWTDPGDQFEWERLERLGLGMTAAPGPLATTAYGGFFATAPRGRLRQNDRDSTQRYGGAPHPTISGVIRELQSDLRTIGYFCPATGVYDLPTRFAVDMFHEHFFAGTRPRAAHHGQVDQATATRIKGVLAAALVARIGGAVGTVGRRLLGGTIGVLGGLLGEATALAKVCPAWPAGSTAYNPSRTGTYSPEFSDNDFVAQPSGSGGGAATLVEAPLQPSHAPGRPSPRAVLHRVTAELPITGKRVRVAKMMDGSGAVVVVATDERTGQVVELAALHYAERRAHMAKYRKLHPLLYDELQRRAATEPVPVALWIRSEEEPVDKEPFLRRVPRRTLAARGDTPQESAAGSPPLGDDAEAPPPELVAYRRTVAEAKARARTALERLRIPVPRELVTVPLLMTTAKKDEIAAIAQLDEVETIFLHDERWVNDLTPSLKVSRAWDVQSVKGYNGSGVRVAVWEDSPEPVMHLRFAAYYDPTRRVKSSHARVVAAIIKNKHPTEPNGYAPACTLCSANLKTLEALEWAVVRQECTVINQSFSDYYAGNRDQLNLEDRVKDYLATHYPFPTIVQAAGNSVNPAHSGQYYVKHKGHNGLVVGSHDDTATGVAETSIYRNPKSPNGDRELPHICANGTDVFVLGDTRSGTSLAAPAVAGVVALLQSVDPQLKPRPEACRAILFAGAHRNPDGGTWWADVKAGVDGKDGAGSLDALASVEIAESRQTSNNTAAERGWDGGLLKPSDFDSRALSRFLYRVQVPESGPRRVKVAVAWNSRTTQTRGAGTTNQATTSDLAYDFDIHVYGDGRAVAFSASFDNSYEVAEFDGKPGKTYTIFIARQSSASDDVHYGIAWTVHP